MSTVPEALTNSVIGITMVISLHFGALGRGRAQREEMRISRSKHGMEGRRTGHMQQSSSRREQVQMISEGELCLDLINSEHFDYRGRRGSQDNLANPEWVAAFAQHWDLPVTAPPDGL